MGDAIGRMANSYQGFALLAPLVLWNKSFLIESVATRWRAWRWLVARRPLLCLLLLLLLLIRGLRHLICPRVRRREAVLGCVVGRAVSLA